jgi:predicted transcriptional regulator
MSSADSENKKYEPWEELPEKNLEKIRKLTEATHKATDNMDYNLATDPIKVPGQNWACISFVSPDSNQKNKNLGMKIRGVFDLHSEAVDHVKRLIKLDPAFDIYICEMYNWCLVPPDPEKITDQTYQNEELNKIVGEYRKNQIYAKEHFEERKREMMEQAADEAKRAALRRIDEESQREMEQGQPPLEPQEDRIVDVTEIENSCLVNSDCAPSDTVTASEIMESMVNGCSKE